MGVRLELEPLFELIREEVAFQSFREALPKAADTPHDREMYWRSVGPAWRMMVARDAEWPVTSAES